MNKVKSILPLVIICLSFGSLSAQKETVILYNVEPIKVELDANGDINQFLGPAEEGYMEGYDLVKKPAIIAPYTANKSEVQSSKNANYAILSNERILLDYKENFATLTKETLNKLNRIAIQLKSDPLSKVLFTAHYSSDSKLQKKLAENRLSSVITYLGIKGIDKSRVETEKQRSGALYNSVAANYIF